MLRKPKALALGVALVFASGAASAQQQATVLPEVKVLGQLERDPVTEGSDSYTSNTTTIGKTPQTLRETPQSASVITRQRMEDQNLNMLQDVLKYTTGMTVQRFDGAGLFNNYYSRGYQADSIQLDGITFKNTGNVTEFDTVIYDRIEVLRGPAGLFQGSGEPGAAINMVRKRALDRLQVRGATSAGSWDAYRGEIDVTNKLNEEGTIRGRIVGAYENRGNYKDVVEAERSVGYGTLEIDLTPTTTLSLGMSKQDINSVIDQGLPAYANGDLLDVSRETFIGANWNTQQLDSSDYFVELQHWFEDGGEFRAAYRYFERDMFYQGARANSAVGPTGNVTIQNVLFTPNRDNHSADMYWSKPFEAFGLKHNFLIGTDWRAYKETSVSAFAPPSVMNVFDPVHNTPKPVFNMAAATFGRVEDEQYGVYGQLRLKASEPLTFILGGRQSHYDAKSSDFQKNEFTPYAATIYDLSKSISVYASYASIFQPQTNVDQNGDVLDPRTGDQYEVGIKGELMNGKLNAHLALFRIKDKNRAIADESVGAPPNSFIASGEVKSEGLEMELGGQLAPNWEISTGYAYVTTEYETPPSGIAPGTTFATFTPEHSFYLWTRYRLSGDWQGWSVGGGVRAVSDFYAQSTTAKFEADAYTVASAMVGYRFSKQLEMTLSVNNLFDEKYYEKVSGTTRQNFYGEPRSFLLAVRADL